ncbi:putative protein N(5)-glutamine methyltransferase [Mycetocola tolaasinivorans]|uniref:peptide chain release factor N(5)-glutamine methyltransferase n=1 Tax=Mycetocola tolaasinivorans TaxID=76635 RepID=A0A3L7AB86_9MICO|nr:putative protein N(5)-glutamine methyltransferase [Mycetocola tolaasinivorans]RLP77255.1 putative protein N(5)-glutamine methyltransferase [Mycetocola tolaasinivorans]
MRSTLPFPREPVIDRLRAAGCVFAEEEATLLGRAWAERGPAQAEVLIQRRILGEPLEQVLGWATFLGLEIRLGAGVFVPRRRTEYLALRAIARAFETPEARVLDLCTGSGAIAAALADRVPDARISASDSDPVALAWARENLGESIPVYLGDLFAPIPHALRGTFDVIVANAPYVPTDSIARMPAEARDFEPSAALDGGEDGLRVHRRILAEAGSWLAPGGTLLIEISRLQLGGLRGAFAAAGLAPHASHDPDREATVLEGTRVRATPAR